MQILYQAQDCGISIHALLAEGDLCALAVSAEEDISIHALLAEGDRL